MALISMTEAKHHLRITTSDQDADINAKLEEASTIVLDYLKSRAGNPATFLTILTSSVANPTVITTELAHTLTNGTSVVITGHVDSVPSVNGKWIIANVAASSFTIPVAVTTAGTGGIVTVPWTSTTAPGQLKAAVKVTLSHLFENRGDDMATDAQLWQALERLLARSRDPALA